jgi:putative methyltransferase (TIGR04325 family)|tara:strand:- start:561 stop:1421 length:861 start_codon:yes stop_codon:yes gene_type:complete
VPPPHLDISVAFANVRATLSQGLSMFSRTHAPSIENADAEAAYLKKFLSNKDENLFMGSFESFQSAQANAPKGLKIGYDEADSADALYSHQIYNWDYAPLFWLSDAMSAGHTSIFDLGGHVGIKYYAFKRVLRYPEQIQWTVCDVPSVVKAGERLALERGASAQLNFCTDFGRASGADVLMLSGSLQYLPETLGEILSQLAHKPKRVLLNITATHSHKTMYTLNSIGDAVCPYRIQFQDEILADIRLAGYKRRDVWRNDGKPIQIPFVEGGADAFYFGCCFDRVSA